MTSKRPLMTHQSNLPDSVWHEIALHGHLVVHHVARLIMVRMWQAVGSLVLVVALSVCRNVAINNIYQLSLSIDEFLVKMAQNRPQIRRKASQNFSNPCKHWCVITTQISIFDQFFYESKRQRLCDDVQVFSIMSVNPSCHSQPYNTRYSVYTATTSFFKFWEKSGFFPLHLTKSDVAAG